MDPPEASDTNELAPAARSASSTPSAIHIDLHDCCASDPHTMTRAPLRSCSEELTWTDVALQRTSCRESPRLQLQTTQHARGRQPCQQQQLYALGCQRCFKDSERMKHVPTKAEGAASIDRLTSTHPAELRVQCEVPQKKRATEQSESSVSGVFTPLHPHSPAHSNTYCGLRCVM
jgi:hypothetical protein